VVCSSRRTFSGEPGDSNFGRTALIEAEAGDGDGGGTAVLVEEIDVRSGLLPLRRLSVRRKTL
jgi:hypothetical protein